MIHCLEGPEGGLEKCEKQFWHLLWSSCHNLAAGCLCVSNSFKTVANRQESVFFFSPSSLMCVCMCICSCSSGEPSRRR